MSQFISNSLREALRAAVQEAISSGPVDDASLETLRRSLERTLQTTTSSPVPTVTDIRYRAMIAALLDEIFTEIRAARRV
jgi:hypothetical protein